MASSLRTLTASISGTPVVGMLLRRPLFALLFLVGVSIVVASLATLIKGPLVTFGLSVETSGFELKVGTSAIFIQDLEAKSVRIEEQGGATTPPSNNPSHAEAKPPFEIGTSEAQLVKLDTLVVPAGSLLRARFFVSDDLLILTVEPPEGSTTKSEATATWYRPTPPGSKGDKPPEMLSNTIQAAGFVIQLGQPAKGSSGTTPFDIRGLQFSTQAANPRGIYPISLLVSGRLQFFAMGTPLEAETVEDGEIVRLSSLEAEVGRLGIGEKGLSLQIFGTAADVGKGFGTAVSSIYPSAYTVFEAQPAVLAGVTLSMGVIMALIGAVSFGAEVRDERWKRRD
ncbi:hypothetical protein EHI46_15520 [Rhizobium leguminosarum]|uniref:hypothetical protein n=1 Tax=Rhizobium leguminosarum TaxID=384 RepID=UPI000FF16FBD|nr:hypothetical protein [Rhizobium leguminosarum]RWY72346.1 hypothetical protein EHI46_15520 [Rhizobium leguminosarum]